MSSIACVWTHLSDDADTDAWFEATHIPSNVAKLGGTARNAEETEDDIFKEVTTIEGKYMTIYDLPDGADAKSVAAQVQPEAENLSKVARMDTRIYKEHATWHGDEWYDVEDVQLFIIVLWQPVAAVYDDFLKWFQDDFVPGMLESPEVLRARMFKLQHALLHEDGKAEEQNIKNMYQFMTVWEFSCQEPPWEVMVYLGSSEKWRYYVEGGYLNWQMAQFLVNRLYPDDEDAEQPARKRASILINGHSGPNDAQEED